MTFLLLAIASSTGLLLIFKLFPRWGVENFQGILFNYVTASSIGFFLNTPSSVRQVMSNEWMANAAAMGIFFFFVFYLMAISSQRIGIALTAVANKMSLVVPVIAAVIFYNESMTVLKAAGIALAVIGVAMAAWKKKKPLAAKNSFLTKLNLLRTGWLLFLVVFLGSGLVDVSVKFSQHYSVPSGQYGLFTASLFGCAALAGGIFCAVTGRLQLKLRNVLGGGLLGSFNYGSIYFLFEALNEMESTVVFPVSNVTVLATSTLAAFFFFREHLSALNWAGILTCLSAIIVIALS